MKKILLIEDDQFLGDTLAQKLISEGYETVLCRDGAEGYQKIKDFKPNLILLDIILPNMNGYEILEAKLKDPSVSNIPVIVVSNSGQPVEINRILALGVKDFLVKTEFGPEEVLVKVREQLNKEDGIDMEQESEKGDIEMITEADNVDETLGLKTVSLDEEALNLDEDISLEGKKIVWVEDDPFLSDIIALKFSESKCLFFRAREGEEALKIISIEIPDIVVLDIILPGMDGFEILHKIKSDPKTKHIPVILLSNLGQPGDVEKGKNLGASRFIVKAIVTPNEIISHIKQVLALQK